MPDGAGPASCSAVSEPAGGGEGGRCCGRARAAARAAERAAPSCTRSTLPPRITLGTAITTVGTGLQKKDFKLYFCLYHI